jgi:ketosteroid isomerase-like protein
MVSMVGFPDKVTLWDPEAMVDLSEFQAMLNRQRTAVAAFYGGDAEPYLALFSDLEPVTVFGAFGPAASGPSAVTACLRTAAAQLSGIEQFRFEIFALDVGQEFAYAVGHERGRVGVAGGPAQPLAVRVTHVYRRGPQGWLIVHRHDATAPDDDPS